MPETSGTPHVNRDKKHTHDHYGNGKQFTKDNDVVHLVVFVNIGGYYQHNRRGSHADEEGEVGYVDPPRDLVRHPRGDKPIHKLIAISPETEEGKDGQADHPRIKTATASESKPDGVDQEKHILTKETRSRLFLNTDAFPIFHNYSLSTSCFEASAWHSTFLNNVIVSPIESDKSAFP